MVVRSSQTQPQGICRVALFTLAVAAFASTMPDPAWSQSPQGSLAVQWRAGSADCTAAPEPPLQIHQYDSRTYILRQSLCADAEANFIYLLIGEKRAMLIDSGAVESPTEMPLAASILPLLKRGGSTLPLLIVHTHGHRDHRSGDGQFASLPSVEIRTGTPEGVIRDFGFRNWPEETTSVDLGGRVVDVIPTPGHHPAHLAFYDRATGAVLTGDFLLPGRLLIDDPSAYQRSAERLSAFLEDRPVSHVLGGHVELNGAGRPYPMGSTHHPDEHSLALTKSDVMGLASRLRDFNGFYAEYPDYFLTNPKRNLFALCALALVIMGGLVLAWNRWRHKRKRRASSK